MNTLPVKLGLATASVAAWLLIGVAADRFEPLGRLLATADLGMHLSAIIFGALVLSPYVTALNWCVPRILALCAASAAIYWSAINFVVEGPLGYDTLLPFLAAGGASALLCALSVALLSARRIGWRLAVLSIAAGTAGGAMFQADISMGWLDEYVLGHLAWQLLVCAALHFGLAPARLVSLP